MESRDRERRCGEGAEEPPPGNRGVPRQYRAERHRHEGHHQPRQAPRLAGRWGVRDRPPFVHRAQGASGEWEGIGVHEGVESASSLPQELLSPASPATEEVRLRCRRRSRADPG
jgi:hypothetical protein